MTQKDFNPFAFSDSNKRYHTYDYYLRHTFGGKVSKLSLDGGFTCPNLDGTCGHGGCIYCSGKGSGDFTFGDLPTVAEQIQAQKEFVNKKWNPIGYLAYFQAHTNTYAPVGVLKKKYEEALAQPQIVGLNIATRADCLPPPVLRYLAELAEQTVLTVELGLQSSNDKTAELIHRGHTFGQFVQAVSDLRQANPKIRICPHLIFGLPEESDEMMKRSVRDVAELNPDELKIHLLHVLKGTPMAELYCTGNYQPLEKERYVELVADALELLPPTTVMERLTGDGKAEDLLAPRWSRDKKTVLNDLDRLLFERNSYQGKKYRKNGF